MSRRSSRVVNTAVIAGIGVLATIGMAAQPVTADTLPASGCLTACTATFDTAGASTFTIPTGITGLEATVAGAAGAPAPVSMTNDPSAVGGAGGAATIQLGTSYAGATLAFGVGAIGEGSYLQAPDDSLLAVAGAGGGGGYAGYLSIPDQILASYPGGSGGSPVTAGVTPGGDGAAFGSLAANGLGGTVTGGAGGTGTASGAAGDSTTLVAGSAVTLAAGGAGGSLIIGGTTHLAGAGGSGYTAGGGGGIQQNVPNGDTDVDVVAPGGGGSGFLASTVTAVAGTPNTGTGYVSFTWSFPPAPEDPALASTGLEIAPWAVPSALLFLGAGAALVLVTRRRRKAQND